MLLRPKPRTFRSFVLRVVAPRLLVFTVGAAVLALCQAIAPADSTSVGPALGVAVETVDAVPVWTIADAAAYPGCVPAAAWPAGRPAAFVVVAAARTREHRRMSFDVAWRLDHNQTGADDVWVLGVCDAHR